MADQTAVAFRVGDTPYATLAAGVRRVGVPYRINGYTVDAQLRCIRAGPAQKAEAVSDAVSDLPVRQAAPCADTVHARVSIPSPFSQPMLTGGPSARRVDDYRRSTMGESMAIEAHLSAVLPPRRPGAARRGHTASVSG